MKSGFNKRGARGRLLNSASAALAVGLGIGMSRSVSDAAAFMLSDVQWTLTERPEDVNTRKLQITIPTNIIPAGYEPLWSRETYATDAVPLAGNFGTFTQQGDGSWLGQAAGASTMGRSQYVRVFCAPFGIAKPVAWNNASVTIASNVKIFTPSSVPSAPSFLQLADGSGTAVAIYLDPAIGNGRTVTAGRYRLNASASWIALAANASQIALTGMDPTFTLGVQWQNVNGYSAETSSLIYAALPTYAALDWEAVDMVANSGDRLQVSFLTTITDPEGLTFIEPQYSWNGTVWYSMPANRQLTTPAAATAANLRLRRMYAEGASPASDVKTRTPSFPVVATDFALVVNGAYQNSSSVLTHAMTTPSHIPAHIAGDKLDAFVAFDGNPTFTVAESGWTYEKLTTTTTGWAAYRFRKTALSSSETLTITIDGATGETCAAHVMRIRDSRSDEVVLVGRNETTSAATIDGPALNMGASEKIVWRLVMLQSGEATAPAAAPTGGWGTQTVTTASATSAGVRVVTTTQNMEAVSLDPASWGSLTNCVAFLVGYRPVLSIPPVTTVIATPSVTSIDQGDTVTFSFASDGRDPKTYSLTIDGTTYSNTTGAPITVSPSAGSKPWTVTISNAAGSASATGTITVATNMAVIVSETNRFQLTAKAGSVSHTVTPASYQLEIQTAAGAAVQTYSQAGADFAITLPGGGDYRLRPRALDSGSNPGAWGDWVYYSVRQVNEITFSAFNVAQSQVVPLSAEAPIEAVPVAGRQIKLLEPLPKLAVETGPAGETLYFNGKMYNPTSTTGLGPHGLDNRKLTDKVGALTAYSPGSMFDLSLMQRTWPLMLASNSTLWAQAGRPTEQLDAGAPGQGHRHGTTNQQGAYHSVAALSGANQCCAPTVKTTGWTADPIDLPNRQAMRDLIHATRLSGGTISAPELANVSAKGLKFNAALRILRGGTHDKDSHEPITPYRTCLTTQDSNYYSNQLFATGACLMFSDKWTDAQKDAWLDAQILFGINADMPGVDFRVGAGIGQHHELPVMISRIARGMSYADLAVNQRGNYTRMFGIHDATSISYLGPHSDPLKPGFSRLRAVTAVYADGAAGHVFDVFYNTKNGDSAKVRYTGLDVVRVSTGERLPFYLASEGDHDNGSTRWGTLGTFSTPLTVSEQLYTAIPAGVTGIAIGEPFWNFSAGLDLNTENFSMFMPTPGTSYRDITEPEGFIAAGHGFRSLIPWPTTYRFTALKSYIIKARGVGWPGTGYWDYGPSATGFTGAFFDANKVALGITP